MCCPRDGKETVKDERRERAVACYAMIKYINPTEKAHYRQHQRASDEISNQTRSHSDKIIRLKPTLHEQGSLLLFFSSRASLNKAVALADRLEGRNERVEHTPL